METNIDKLKKLRDYAILTKSPLQFGLTSLIVNLEYGLEEESTKKRQEELIL